MPRSFPYRFSIVVPTYNRRDVLVDTLTALAAVQMHWPCELIVVVDGSTDGSEQAARRVAVPFPKQVITQPNRGAAAARNRGVADAGGEFLLFLDDDMEADPRLLVEHDRALRAGADAVVGHIPLHPATPSSLLARGVERWSRQRRARLLRAGSRLTLPDLLTGQLSVRANTFAAAGGFDPSFTAGGTFGAEDTDFLYRLMVGGATVRFAPDAVTFQRYVVTPEQHLRQWRQGGRADASLSRKHPALGMLLLDQHCGRSVTGRLLRIASRKASSRSLAAVTSPVVTRARSGRTDWPTAWAFSRLRDIEYWRGVREGGGLRLSPATVTVLAYHAVDEVADQHIGQYAVPPELLARQLSAMTAAGFQFITAERFLAHLDGHPVPDRSVLVTFDDGYRSLHDRAAPLLRRHGILPVVFLVTGHIGGCNEWDAGTGAARLPLLDATQLADLAAEGWVVGAHSRSHPHLPALGPAELADELTGARRDLVAAGLTAPRLLAYPYGEHNARIRAAARKAGYSAAFGLAEHRRRAAASSRYAIPRVEVTRDMTAEALVRLVLDPPRRPFLAAQRELRGVVRAALTARPGRRRVAW